MKIYIALPWTNEPLSHIKRLLSIKHLLYKIVEVENSYKAKYLLKCKDYKTEVYDWYDYRLSKTCESGFISKFY